ncbi:MAG: amino acid adenylation domain-containing protein [Clostridia bacterium]|nr:amino acid adenylation domain-containing protein [Clostridia bacterium]
MKFTKPQKLIYNTESFSGGAISVICTSVFFKGQKSDLQLQNAVNELYRLNDALRIRIIKNGSECEQYVSEFVEQNFDILHFNSNEDFYNFADAFAKIPITLTGQLCEIKIVVFPDKYGLLVKIHHIISDAWTVALLATQFNRLLSNEIPPAYSYLDYYETEQNYLNSKRYLKDKEFFLEQFRTCEQLTFISEKKAESTNAERKTFILPVQFAREIRDFAEIVGCSVLSVLITVIGVYFCHLVSSSDKFFVGTTILNRYTEKELNTAGMFINSIPLLVSASAEKTFAENLKYNEDTLMSVFRHQKYNQEDILADIRKDYGNIERLYDVLISYMNATIDSVDAPVESTWHHNGSQNESLQISFDDREKTGVFKIRYDYQIEKFTEADIELLHKHLCKLLHEVIVTPDKKITEFELVSTEEKQQIKNFNTTDHKYDIPDNSTLYSIFDKAAKENSEKICIKTAEREISFGEFLAVAEKTDRRIRDITGNKKSVIAVITERSPEMYGAIYGVIRGGNAYLPIDPEYPQERIEYILENSNASAVAVQGKFAGLVKNLPCVDMTEILYSSEEEKENIPFCSATPEDTAYVIYTSGSTGNPKGAKISHKSALNRILWMHDRYPLGNNDVILQKTPYTFDVSVWEHFWWGLTGGCLAVSKPGEHFIPAKILEETHKNSVTHLHFVPSVFELFLNYLDAHRDELYKFDSVKYVFLSGEALSASLVQRFYKLYDSKKVTLHNLYGPTECAVDVTCYDCRPEDVDPVPIGKPVYNTQIYITDKYLNTVPIGVQGEICIAGMNVGQGYLNKPELTAEKFIDNPFGEGKLYKTGDIGYWRDDGNLVFAGRKDSQIKLNGQRIELGEIEAVINEITGVTSSAVIVKNVNGADILAAFFTGEADVSYIKDVCSVRLPSYMIPGAIIHLDKLPLNLSGKLDRKALSEMDIELSPEGEFAEPENETEKLICEVFSRVLDVKNVGRNSNFFTIGGTSLSMISILSEDIFENITAAEFIRNSTPAKLSRILGKSEGKKLEYLELLHKSDNSEKVLILFPYAGGGAEAFSRLVSDFIQKNKDVSVYFVPYLHTSEECKKVAREIADNLSGKDIFVYSHCVGASVALQIIKILEDRNVPVKHYLAGALIPPSNPRGKNIWNKVSDSMLKAILMKAGAPLELLSENEITDILRRFREDTDFANLSFAGIRGKISTPVSVLISKRDLFTKNHLQTERLWNRYAKKLAGIHFIDSKDHYFQSSSPEKIIEILENSM